MINKNISLVDASVVDMVVSADGKFCCPHKYSVKWLSYWTQTT